MSEGGCSCATKEPAVDPAYRRVLWLVLGINAAMFGIEGVAGLIAGSVALQGDSLDFLGDAANYAIALMVLGRAVAWRAGAAMVKGLTMAGFGAAVLASTAWRALHQGVPDAALMAPVGVLALAANLFAAFLLYRWRSGDSNMRSVWLCSRNDALVNLAVLAAAGLVALTGAGWPDWLVALFIAAIALSGGLSVIRQASGELRARATL